MSDGIKNCYYFIGGIIVGKISGIIPIIIISGILLYSNDPTIFSYDNIINSKNVVIELVNNITTN